MDKQTPTEEPIAPQEPSEAFVVAHKPVADPFAGSWQDNATVRVGTWAGLPNYECSACGYAHLDEAKANAHVATHGQTFTEGA
jgi:hypothetical protein